MYPAQFVKDKNNHKNKAIEYVVWNMMSKSFIEQSTRTYTKTIKQLTIELQKETVNSEIAPPLKQITIHKQTVFYANQGTLYVIQIQMRIPFHVFK